MNEFLEKLNNFALLLFVFGVNFENWDPFGLQGVFSIAKMTAIIYIVSWIPLLSKIRFQPLKPFLIPLLFYLLLEFLSSSINSAYVFSILRAFNFKLVQLLILLILIVNHIYRNNKILDWIIYSFIANVFLLSILSALGIGYEVSELKGGRLEIFGENPNMLGMKASFAIIMLLYYTFNIKKFWIKGALILVIIPIVIMLIATASRGALLSVFAGLAVMVLIHKTNVFRKIFLFFLGIIVSFWLFNFIMSSNENFAARINSFIEEGNTGREDLWYGAQQIIIDNIIFGIGRPAVLPMMEKYIGRAMDPHNVFLYILMTTGIVGFTFFMTFMYRLTKQLYKKFKLTNNVVYLVLFFILLINMSKAGAFIDKTFLWFFFAVLIGASLHSYNSKSNENIIRNRSLSNKHSPQ